MSLPLALPLDLSLGGMSGVLVRRQVEQVYRLLAQQIAGQPVAGLGVAGLRLIGRRLADFPPRLQRDGLAQRGQIVALDGPAWLLHADSSAGSMTAVPA